MLNFNIITLFPEFFASPLAVSLMGRARENNLVKFTFINPRDFSSRPHRNVDDRPFGGGPGMLMQLEPLLGALDSIPRPGPILQTSPGGDVFNADMAKTLSFNTDITIICGRYEGIDARLPLLRPMREVTVCQAVLNGGETAALAIIEAVCRFLPGFLGKDESSAAESYAEGLLEHPQYTRPDNYKGLETPKELLGGNHAEIAAWRRRASLEKTLRTRPSLLDSASLDENDARWLKELPRRQLGRNLSFCLCHFPVRLEGGRVGSSSLTNLDIHDIGRISRSYGMGPFFVLLSLREQREILDNILKHWRKANQESRGDRQAALSQVCPVQNFAELEEKAAAYYGMAPVYVASSAAWPDRGGAIRAITPEEIRKICAAAPVVILLGTGRGLDLKSLALNFRLMRPLRFLNENHLSVRAAAAIIADRTLGDFY